MTPSFNALLIQDSTSLKAILFLALAFVFCFLSRKHLYWFACTAIFIALGVMANRLNLVAVGFLLFTGAATGVYFLKPNLPRWLQLVMATVVFSCGAALSMHLVPGFKNWLIGDGLQLGQAVPFDLYLNFDKPFFGVVFFALAAGAARSQRSWFEILSASFMALVPGAVVVLGLASAMGWLQYQAPAPPQWTGLWFFKNLFLTVIAEEALFRGLLQKELKALLPAKWSKVSLIVAAIAFGLAHWQGGSSYVIAASLAGLFYGWAWERSGGRLEAAILTHLGLNCVHFFFFSYPWLPH